MTGYDHDSAVEAAEDVIELAEDYDGVNVSDVASGLVAGLQTYTLARIGLLGGMTGKYSTSATPAEMVQEGVEAAEAAIEKVDIYRQTESEANGEAMNTLLSAKEQLVHNPKEAFDAKAALEG